MAVRRHGATHLMVLLLSACFLMAPSASGADCPPDAAFNAVMRAGSQSAIGDFLYLVKRLNLQAELRQAASGRALVVPSNSAVLQLKVALKQALASKLCTSATAIDKSTVFSHGFKPTQYQRKIISNMIITKAVVDATQFRATVKPKDPCHLVAVIPNLNRGVYNSTTFKKQNERWYPQNVPTLEHIFTPASTTRRQLKQTIGTVAFAGVGTGYDSIIANPVVSIGSATDPGLFKGVLFIVNSSSASLNSASTCSSASTVVSSTSTSSYQSSLAVSVGVTGSYQQNSCSANVDYQEENSGSDANSAFSFVGGAVATVGVGQLKSLSSSGVALDPGFLNLAWGLANLSPSDTATQQAYLQAIYMNYGTHYTTKMTVGGFQNVIVSMSASSSTSLSQNSISVSANVEVTYGLASGKVDSSAASSSANAIQAASKGGSFTYQLAPGVAMPDPSGGWKNASSAGLTSDQCQGWITNMKNGNNGNGDYAYPTTNGNSFKVAPIASIFSVAYMNLFPGWTTSQVSAVYSLINSYMSSGCPAAVAYGYTCQKTSANCNPGYTQTGTTNGVPNCQASGTLSSGLFQTLINGFSCLSQPFSFNCPGQQAMSQNFAGVGSSSGVPVPITNFPSAWYINNGYPYTFLYTGYMVPLTTGWFWFQAAFNDDFFQMWADIPGGNGGQCAQGALVGTPSQSNYVTMSNLNSPSPSGPYYMVANVAYAVRIQYSNVYYKGGKAVFNGMNVGMSTSPPPSTGTAAPPTMKAIQTATTMMTFKYYPSGGACWPKVPTGWNPPGTPVCTASSDPFIPLYPSGYYPGPSLTPFTC